jgi:hypothetical protein
VFVQLISGYKQAFLILKSFGILIGEKKTNRTVAWKNSESKAPAHYGGSKNMKVFFS